MNALTKGSEKGGREGGGGNWGGREGKGNQDPAPLTLALSPALRPVSQFSASPPTASPAAGKGATRPNVTVLRPRAARGQVLTT